MSTEMMTDFIIIPKRAWGKVPTWKTPAGTKAENSEISFVDIMNEQLQEKVEEEEFENYIKETYVSLDNDFVNLESDLQYSKLLKSCLDEELNLHVLELNDEEESEDEEDAETDYNDDSALIESTFFSKINEHFNKHSHSSKRQHQDPKQNKKCVREKTKSQSDIDSDTRKTLYKFMQKSVLKDNYGVVNKGKKSLILHAQGGIKKSEKGDSVRLPGECAIKVFKPLLTNNDPKVADDESRPVASSSCFWAHREFQNLKKMERAGVPCPSPAFVKKSLLVMEFVGKDGKQAWKLRDYPFTNENALRVAYDQVIHNMKIMYKNCHLVHSDLTEKSILWWNNQCYFTDVAHALEAGSNNSHAFLYRNCRNIVDFFTKKGLSGIQTIDSLFKDVTGFEYPGVAVDIAAVNMKKQ